VNGLLNLTAPLGYMLGLVLALVVGPQIGWRNVFFITGIVDVGLALIIFSTVREVPRGQAEPELADLDTIVTYRFDWRTARSLLRNRTLLPLAVYPYPARATADLPGWGAGGSSCPLAGDPRPTGASVALRRHAVCDEAVYSLLRSECDCNCS